MKNHLLLLMVMCLLPCFACADAEEDRAAWLDAAREGDLTTLQRMLTNGFNIEATNNKGSTALKIASNKGHYELVNFLITKGARIDTINHIGNSTPLNAAAKRGHLNIVTLLLKHGADINYRSKKGYTSLHLAAKNNHYRVVEALLQAGANFKTQNNKGKTPLSSAANRDGLESVQLLLAAGADPLILDNEGVDVVHQSGAGSKVRDIVLGTMNGTSIVFNLSQSDVNEVTFAAAIQAVLIDRGWSPQKISDREFHGQLQDGARHFRVSIKRIGDNLLLKFLRGYGSNKSYYLENIKHDLLLTLKLK